METEEAITPKEYYKGILGSTNKAFGVPESTFGKIYFQYISSIKGYTLASSTQNIYMIEALCRRKNIPVSEIASFLKSVNNTISNHTSTRKVEAENPSYRQSMKILYLACICFTIFFLMSIIDVYQIHHLKLIDIALPFGYFGIGFCVLVMITQGRITLDFSMWNCKKRPFNSEVWQNVFDLINKENKIMQGVQWNMGGRGKWLVIFEEDSEL